MRALCDSYLTRKKETFRKRQVEVSLHFELSARQRGDSGWAALRSALGLVCVAEEEDPSPSSASGRPGCVFFFPGVLDWNSGQGGALEPKKPSQNQHH